MGARAIWSACLAAGLEALPMQGQAAELRLLEPREISVDAYQYHSLHDPYLAPVDADIARGGTFRVNGDLLEYCGYRLFWNNFLHFDQSEVDGRIKHAGWNYEMGATLLRFQESTKAEIFWQHHSRHVLEEAREEHFPVYDRAGIRLILFRKE